MHLNAFFPSPSLFSLIITLFLYSSHASNPEFERCTPFECGKFKGLRYPFWTDFSPPPFCGHPDCHLDCQQDNPSMSINSVEYTIIDIHPDSRILTIARKDYFEEDGICQTQSNRNTSVDGTLFRHTKRDLNALIFYDCEPFENTTMIYNFSCPEMSPHNSGHFVINPPDDDLSRNVSERCDNWVEVRVLKGAPDQELRRDSVNIGNVLRKGFEVEWVLDAKFCGECEESGGKCGYSWKKSLCFCADRDNTTWCDIPPQPPIPSTAPTYSAPTTSKKIAGRRQIDIWGIALGTSAALGIGLFICFLIYFNKKLKRKRPKDKMIETFIRQQGSMAPRRYKYSELKKFTNSFRHELGKGGYGKVYEGSLPDNRHVAVKVLNESKRNGEEFVNEVASIGRTSHVNVVSLLGFCYEGRKRALVYEFMPNKSLEKFINYSNPLSGNHQLGCEKLIEIATGIARGLEYLHRGCNTRILHLDIKPHNILLDQDFCPKISDFGLSKLCFGKDNVVSMSEARGTIGYIAPEVFSRNFGVISHKSDVYSYGMMVLEMVGGRHNVDIDVVCSSEIYFPHWIYKRLELDNDLKLPGFRSDMENETARKMIIVGLWCKQTDPSQRPSMSKVLEMLEGSIETLQIPPKPFLSSPPRSATDSSSQVDVYESFLLNLSS